MASLSATGSQLYRLEYPRSKFWLIFWGIFFFPVALVLLLTGAVFTGGGKVFALKYSGQRFWLAFWVVIFFPIALLLIFSNGIELEVQETQSH